MRERGKGGVEGRRGKEMEGGGGDRGSADFLRRREREGEGESQASYCKRDAQCRQAARKQ
eukprot:1292870-Rhodomonas_salina.1